MKKVWWVLCATAGLLLVQCGLDGCGNNPKHVSRGFARKLIMSSVDDVVNREVAEAKKRQFTLTKEDIADEHDRALGMVLTGDSGKVEDAPSFTPISDAISIGEDGGSTGLEGDLRNALVEVGYLSRTVGGAVTEIWDVDKNHPIHWSQSQFFTMTEKGKPFITGCKDVDSPTFSNQLKQQRCDFPKMSDQITRTFEVTGVSQLDDAHTDVHVLSTLKWHLTPFAQSLRSIARKLDDPGRSGWISGEWYCTLDYSPADGQRSFPSIIHFQRFDDGWRIVDKEGKSLKDVER